jgi:hypothetical protein
VQDKEVTMRMMRKALLLSVAGLVVGAVLAVSATAGTGGRTHPIVISPHPWWETPAAIVTTPVRPVIAGASLTWVQPPARIPIVAPTPVRPANAGATLVWVQPPAWVPIAS